jgi:hypothetical protein
MKLPREQAQKVIWDALFKAEGNREKAAELMGVSPRTFYRYLRDHEMYPIMDRMGWTSHAGPPRGEPKGSSVVRMRILAFIKAHRGVVDYGKLSVDIYGEDNPTTRQRLYSTLEQMKSAGRVAMDEETGRWSIVPQVATKTVA